MRGLLRAAWTRRGLAERSEEALTCVLEAAAGAVAVASCSKRGIVWAFGFLNVRGVLCWLFLRRIGFFF